MGRNYERLAIEPFGKQLLVSGDLDPIYLALRQQFFCPAGSIPQAKRWMVAYWCFYHAGQASYISEAQGGEFWARMRECARNEALSPIGERWQRGHERRHFRGEAASKAVRTMAGRYLNSPEELVDAIIGEDPADNAIRRFSDVSERAQDLPLFGPWIGFKVADMLDRVLGIEVDFNVGDVFAPMFKDPTKAALMLWRKRAGGIREDAKIKIGEQKAVHDVVSYLIDHFKGFKAPPLGDRPVGVQEVETILCKWKSHMNGHYPLFNDIDEIRAGVEPWVNVSETAAEFLQAMPSRMAS